MLCVYTGKLYWQQINIIFLLLFYYKDSSQLLFRINLFLFREVMPPSLTSFFVASTIAFSGSPLLLNGGREDGGGIRALAGRVINGLAVS